MSSSRPLFAPVYADGREGRGPDRRRDDRRAPRRAFDPLFAASLVNQLARAETGPTGGYRPAPGPRAGVAFDLSA